MELSQNILAMMQSMENCQLQPEQATPLQAGIQQVVEETGSPVTVL